MAPMYSFKPALAAALKSLQPKTVLEWGPGRSTMQILACRSVERVLSIEHNLHWYHVYCKEMEHEPRLRLKLIPDMDEYVARPTGTFDLIYVDGRRRNQCLHRAKTELVDRNGLVLIHDAERAAYYDHIVDFPFKAFAPNNWVAAMSFSRRAIDRWQQLIQLAERERV